MLESRLPDSIDGAPTATHGAAVTWRIIFLMTCELHHRAVLPETLGVLGVLGLGIFCWPIMMSGPPRSVLLRLSTEKRIREPKQLTYAKGTVGVFRHQNNNVRARICYIFDVGRNFNAQPQFGFLFIPSSNAIHQSYPLFGSETPSDAENNFRGHAALFRFCPYGFLQKHIFFAVSNRVGRGSSDAAWKLAINASSEHYWSVPAGTQKTWLHVFDFEQ